MQVWSAIFSITLKHIGKILGRLNIPEQLELSMCQLSSKLHHTQLQQRTGTITGRTRLTSPKVKPEQHTSDRMVHDDTWSIIPQQLLSQHSQENVYWFILLCHHQHHHRQEKSDWPVNKLSVHQQSLKLTTGYEKTIS